MRHATRKPICLIIAVILILGILPAGALADTTNTAMKYPSYELLNNSTRGYDYNRGITVLPDGSIYTIITNYSTDYIIGFTAAGEPNGIKIEAPPYTGNMCSSNDGTIFTFTNNESRIRFFRPNIDSEFKEFRISSAIGSIQALNTDAEGNLYCMTKLYGIVYLVMVNAEKLATLKGGDRISADKNWTINYPAVNSNGTRYPAGFDVDSDGILYLADKGTSKGSDSAVNGIYRYELATGKYEPMFFDGVGTTKFEWVRSVEVDESGYVTVLSRNSHILARFAPGENSAQLASTIGWIDDIALNSDGDIYIASSGNVRMDGILVYRSGNVRVRSVTMPKSIEVRIGETAVCTATVSPDNAANKTVFYSSSDTSIVKVDSTGMLKPIAPGKATITAKTKDGGLKATCAVTVLPELVADGWKKVDGKWYYGRDGSYVTGLCELNGYQRGNKTGLNSYYFNDDGSLYGGFMKIDNEWRYFVESGSNPQSSTRGQMLLNYYADAPASGYRTAAEIAKNKTFRYYFDGEGILVTGWHKNDFSYDKSGKWRYFYEAGSNPAKSRLGRMAKYGLLTLPGNGEKHKYFFSNTGGMFRGTNSLGEFAKLEGDPSPTASLNGALVEE